MKTLSRQEANIVWDKLWSNMKTEWFKLEVLQDYSVEDKSESLSTWMAGDRKHSIELLLEEPHEWADDCRKKVEEGVRLTRIHVVDYPLSDYIQWEIEVYKQHNIPIGHEDVYLIDRKDIAKLSLPAGDLMMFDQTNVVIGNYDASGYAVTQTFYNASDNITKFLRLREELLNSNLRQLQP